MRSSIGFADQHRIVEAPCASRESRQRPGRRGDRRTLAEHVGRILVGEPNHGRETPPTFLPARPISQSDLAALTERVRRRVIRWFRMRRLLDVAAAAGMRQEAAAGGHGGDGSATASKRSRPQAAEASGTANWDAVCADARKTPPQGDARRFGEPSPDGRHAQSRCSRTVRQPEDRSGSAIDRAILRVLFVRIHFFLGCCSPNRFIRVSCSEMALASASSIFWQHAVATIASKDSCRQQPQRVS